MLKKKMLLCKIRGELVEKKIKMYHQVEQDNHVYHLIGEGIHHLDGAIHLREDVIRHRGDVTRHLEDVIRHQGVVIRHQGVVIHHQGDEIHHHEDEIHHLKDVMLLQEDVMHPQEEAIHLEDAMLPLEKMLQENQGMDPLHYVKTVCIFHNIIHIFRLFVRAYLKAKQQRSFLVHYNGVLDFLCLIVHILQAAR